MPKLKYEFMNQYYKSHRRPLRDYLFGYFHVAAKVLSPFAPLTTAFMQMSWSKKIIARALGIAEQRPFPEFVNRRQVGKHTSRQLDRNKAVIFLSDVFSHYIEPEVEDAAIEILNRLGYAVHVLPIIGAGASLLSKGFLGAARRHARQVLSEIQRLDGGAGISVVGCEPPEVYCLKHEYKSLLPELRNELQSITEKVWLVDEFILRVVNLGDYISPVKMDKERLTLHPHCHHRAEGPAADGLPSGVAATVEMLKLFGYEPEVIDAGCCGMAGTFGYDAEHYELSMQVGELGVLPKIRPLRPTDTSPKFDRSTVEFGGGRVEVASSGAACRMQIKQGAGVDALHPLLLVKERLQIL